MPITCGLLELQRKADQKKGKAEEREEMEINGKVEGKKIWEVTKGRWKIEGCVGKGEGTSIRVEEVHKGGGALKEGQGVKEV